MSLGDCQQAEWVLSKRANSETKHDLTFCLGYYETSSIEFSSGTKVVESNVPKHSGVHINRIRQLNDQLRCEGVGGQVLCTSAILTLKTDQIGAIGDAVQSFNDFNDPFDEHDFGLIQVDDQRIVFKIYVINGDPHISISSQAEPAFKMRLMIIMLASEY